MWKIRGALKWEHYIHPHPPWPLLHYSCPPSSPLITCGYCLLILRWWKYTPSQWRLHFKSFSLSLHTCPFSKKRKIQTTCQVLYSTVANWKESWILNSYYRGAHNRVQNIVQKDPGRARPNSLATAGTNFTKLGVQKKADPLYAQSPNLLSSMPTFTSSAS